jgi:amino acid transporter
VVGVISASGKGGGVASPLSVLIAAVGVFAIGAIVCRYAREVHAAGSLYDYVTRGLGERTGTAAGWLYYAGITVLMTGLLLLIGGYLESTLAAEFKVDPLPAWAWTLLVIALIAVVLYFGVRVSVRSQLVLALISIIVVTIFFIVTAGAIYGSFYKVTSPTIYAPWIALAVLVIGFASTFVTRARRSASSELSDLTKSTA